MRIELPPSRAIWNHNAKFGVSLENLPELLTVARELNVRVDGVAFHVGTPSLDPRAHANAVRAGKRALEVPCTRVRVHSISPDMGSTYHIACKNYFRHCRK